MPRGPTTRRADLDRALAALDAAGYAPGRVVITPGGGVEIIPTAKPAAGKPPLTDTPPAPQVSDLDSWRERKGGRRAP